MTNKNHPDREFAVGDKFKVTLHDGRIVDATVRAIVDDGGKLQVDFGHEEAAMGEPSQVVDKSQGHSVSLIARNPLAVAT
jgi:hypothetical protein